MDLTILILAIANAVVPYASYQYPSKSGQSELIDHRFSFINYANTQKIPR